MVEDSLVGRRLHAGRRIAVVTVLVVTALVVVAPVGATEGSSTGANVGSQAAFEGKTIDLSVDWESAEACLIWDEIGLRECFRTEAEMVHASPSWRRNTSRGLRRLSARVL